MQHSSVAAFLRGRIYHAGNLTLTDLIPITLPMPANAPIAPIPLRLLAPLLAALAAIGPFSIDTYLPAFPAIGAAFNAAPAAVQQTLTAYLLPFSAMILWHGAFADAWGRRRVLLTAYALYTLASLFCALAPSLHWLLLGRALQGISAGAGMVVGRAIVRDLFDGPQALKLMAQIGMMFAIAPAVAPVIGGWVQHYFNWHGVFVLLALYGAALCAALYAWLPETLDPAARQSLAPRPLWAAYREVFSHRGFQSLALTLALNFNGFFVYVLSAPMFLITHLHVSPQGFLWLFGPCMVGMMLGNYVSGRLAGVMRPARVIRLGFRVMFAAAGVNLTLSAFLPPMLPWSVLPLGVYVFGMALGMPALSLAVLDYFPQRRGLVSSCQGTAQTGVNALTAALFAPLAWGSTLTLAAAMLLFMALGWAAYAARRKMT